MVTDEGSNDDWYLRSPADITKTIRDDSRNEYRLFDEHGDDQSANVTKRVSGNN